MAMNAILDEMQIRVGKVLKDQLCRWFIGVVIIVLIIPILSSKVSAQDNNTWSPEQQIPGYHPDTDPPLMIVDQNKTVHAFTSQWFDENENRPVRAIVYNKWTYDYGWTHPVDILLSPIKNDARLLDVFLDQAGTMHIVFFGGDGTEANIYYSKAPAINAGDANAWSIPVFLDQANDPGAAAFAGDDEGNLVIVYSGMREGWGLYVTYSDDKGETWTEPAPLFLTYFEQFPVYLDLHRGQSGMIHAVWDTRTIANQGREINYARLNLNEKQWSDPILLSKADAGLGVMLPSVVEHNNVLIISYSGIIMQYSVDGGFSWSEPSRPFPQTGINGASSFVVDGSNVLHFLWGQRLTGSPDIHGVWHSIKQGTGWSEPESIVSGPQVPDFYGNNAFDPTDIRAVVIQGNTLLITWRQDPALKGNGVWYSYKVLESPEYPVLPLPSEPSTPLVRNQLVTEIVITPTVLPLLEFYDSDKKNVNIGNPTTPVFFGIVPVFILILAVTIFFQLSKWRNH